MLSRKLLRLLSVELTAVILIALLVGSASATGTPPIIIFPVETQVTEEPQGTDEPEADDEPQDNNEPEPEDELPIVLLDDIQVTVDGVPVTFTDAIPFADANFRTMIPLRAVADALGCEVTWNQTVRTARIFRQDCISRGYGASSIYKNGLGFQWKEDAAIALYLHTGIDQIFYETAYELYDEDAAALIESGSGAGLFTIDTQPVAMDGRIYLPIRAVAEAFGYNVFWKADTKTVSIESGGIYMSSVTAENSVYLTGYPDWIGDLIDYQ